MGPGVKRALPFLSWINAEVNAEAWDCSHSLLRLGTEAEL